MIGTGTNAPSNSVEDILRAPEELAIVERVARIVSSVYSAKPDYTRLAAEVAQAISFDVFGIVLLHYDHKAVRITVCQRNIDAPNEDVHRNWIAQHHQHPFTDSMLECLLQETTLKVKSYPHGLAGPPASSGDALSNYPQLRATCIVPLRTKERILGTLELGSTSVDSYADSTVQRLIGAVAQVLATAIERTQLEGSAEIQDRQRQALKDVSRALTSTMDLSTILTHIADGVSKALDVASAIVTFDQRDEQVNLVVQSGLDEAVLKTIINENFVLKDSCIIGSTLLHRQSYMSNDIENDERFFASHVLTSILSIRSILTYPLIIGSTIYGALLLCSEESGGFTPLKTDIVALFATQATIAIHNGTLLRVAHQRHHFQDTIEQLEQEVASHSRSVLARTGIVSELSTLLMQVQHPTKGIRDAWFVTDLSGTCIYMNPVAEAFCAMHLVNVEKTHMSLEHVFANLFPRIRNSEEVRHYLQDIALSNVHKQELRCVVALEPLSLRTTASGQTQDLSTKSHLREATKKRSDEQERVGASLLRTMLLENAPSDSHYLFTCHPLHNQQGELTAYAVQVRDITIQVRDEKNKAALLSSVSHDLRTPLTTIKAAVSGLLQTDIPWDEQMRREMLEDIDAETDHLTVLVNALVEMSRIEMGALILEKEWCDITEVVYETLIKAKRILAKRNVKTHFHNDLPLVSIDHVQIGRVLYNLIENAARHSPEQAEITIYADVVTDELAQAMVRIQVIDEGCGIPVHERERIFKSFYGLRSHGSGLGLAICKGIIETHHGRIWVESADKGSCFVFTLPTNMPMA